MDMGPVGVIRNLKKLDIPILRPITLTTSFVSSPGPVPGYSSVALTTGNRTGVLRQGQSHPVLTTTTTNDPDTDSTQRTRP